MFDLGNPFSSRTVSSFGLSIGTGIALESLFTPTTDRYDTDREIPIDIKVDDYKLHAYNIYTLIRNIVSSSESKDKVSLYKSKHLKDILTEEVDIIKELYANTNVDLLFYVNDYSKMYKKYNSNKDVKPNKAYEEYLLMSNNFKILETLPKGKASVLVITNYLVDLVNAGSGYHLLESHTGKLKTTANYNTKYHPIGKRDMSLFPFNEILLTILGDKTIVRPSKLGTRVKLYELALDRRWNIRTSLAKVKSDIQNDENLKVILDVNKE